MSYLRTIFLRNAQNKFAIGHIHNKSKPQFKAIERCSSVLLGGDNMNEESKKTFDCWHQAVSNRDGSFLSGRINSDVVFRPPTYFKPWKGEEELKVILTCAAEVFGDSFRYKRQWLSPCGREWALEFETEIGESGKTMNGIDLVSLVNILSLFFMCVDIKLETIKCS